MSVARQESLPCHIQPVIIPSLILQEEETTVRGGTIQQGQLVPHGARGGGHHMVQEEAGDTIQGQHIISDGIHQQNDSLYKQFT